MWRRAECKLQRGRSKHWIRGSSLPACRGVRGPARGTPTGTMASSQGKNELKFADWMATLPESIHSIPLTNLAIPGRCAEAADGALTCPALHYLPRSGNLPRCPREGNSSPGEGLRPGERVPGSLGPLAFCKPLGTVARRVKVTAVALGLGSRQAAREGWGRGSLRSRIRLAPPPTVLLADLGGWGARGRLLGLWGDRAP